MPFQKKHAFEPTEVLLYLSIFAPNMVAMKLGETDTVTLNYSDFMTSAKCRLSFFHDTGFVPLIMRVAINECKEPLPIDSAVFLEDQCQAIQENLMEFSCSEPHSSFGTYEKHRFAQVSAVVFEQALKEKLSRKEVVHDVLFRIIVGMYCIVKSYFWFLLFIRALLGLPIPDSQQKYVDQRFFVRSLTERSNIYDPLYPAVLKCARNYLAEDKSLPNVIASHLEESKEKHRPASERGYILERLFVLTCHAHVTALHSKFEAKVAGGNSYLNFNMVPQIKQFHGVFPDIKESGIYWSISPTYPFVEGFFYNGKILAGIQVTVRAPKEHSSNKVPTRRTMELLEKIADFCEPRKIGFSLVYAVPKEQFEKLDVFNLLEIESFAACQGSSSFCPSPFV